MARFKIELREDEHKSFDTPFQKLSGPQPLNSAAKKDVVLNENSDEGTTRYRNDSSVTDYEAMESTNAIIGLCPDMCPGMHASNGFSVCKAIMPFSFQILDCSQIMM